MDDKTRQLYQEITDTVLRGRVISPQDIPNIDIYMDQLTTFMDRRLRMLTRNPEKDKVLTKTMINNYTKNDLLPPPVKKKYSREHLILLIYIFYLKNNLSISDINKLLKPVKELHGTDSPDALSLMDVYREVLQWRDPENDALHEDLARIYELSKTTFPEIKSAKQRIRLQRFALLFLLSRDICLKQMIIERLLDAFEEEEQLRGDDRKKKKTKPGKEKASGKQPGKPKAEETRKSAAV